MILGAEIEATFVGEVDYVLITSGPNEVHFKVQEVSDLVVPSYAPKKTKNSKDH